MCREQCVDRHLSLDIKQGGLHLISQVPCLLLHHQVWWWAVRLFSITAPYLHHSNYPLNNNLSVTRMSVLWPSRAAQYCDQFVCLSVHDHGPTFTKFCVQIPCGRGSVLQRCVICYDFRFYGWRHVWPYDDVLRYVYEYLVEKILLQWLLQFQRVMS